MKATMKDKGKTSRELPGQIVAAQIAQAEDNVRAECGKVESIKRTVQRGNLPKEPTTLKDLVLEGEWTETTQEIPDSQQWSR